MQRSLELLSTFFVRLLTSPPFWIAVIAVIAWRLLVIWYRACKLHAMGQMEYTRSFSSDGVFAGETLELTETLRNSTLFPLFFVKMEFFVPGGFTIDGIVCKEHTKVTSIFHIPPYAKAKKTHMIKADTRGHYQLVNTSAEYRKNEFIFSHPFDIYVYPSYSDIKTDIPSELFHAGNSISMRKYIEDPFFMSGIRQYQIGDPMRTINFKASVRSFRGGMRQLMSNAYDSSRNFDSMIFLDLYARSEHGKSVDEEALLENGLSFSCRLLQEVVRHGGSVGFASNLSVNSRPFVNIPCGTGDEHIKDILRCFAEMSAYSSRNYAVDSLLIKTAENLSRGTDIYLITPQVDITTAQAIRTLERTGRNVQIIPLIERR